MTAPSFIDNGYKLFRTIFLRRALKLKILPTTFSSSFNYSESFRKIKTEQEKVKLNFKSQNNEIYNKDFN